MNRQCLIGFATYLLAACPGYSCHSIGSVNSISSINVSNATQNLPEVQGNKFLYFGFGSNMLAKRIHIQNPTAVRIGPALLEGYRLDFAFVSKRWDGAVATIVPTPGDSLWGTLWEIDLSNLPDIDNQEGVHLGIYEPRTVYVKRQNASESTPARAYLLIQQPETNLYELSQESIPASRQPSKTYLQCLVQGAIESSIPEDYVRRLKGIRHNNRVASKLEETLDLKEVQL
ncbi:uncharacterized protein Dana_GF10818 [Drosophila ananassae]|uniref:gamma-glutamylcyclotransferase n=1 Tax=Drosophila ananassae TaxID=7217 RepID=B3M8A5_DROAN|nr:gamma-glutamylcyclotransferase [Drosophila ananassae]EDV41044.1 uncharacterized protein Dana_GF10818 [Drosophila ananassae]